MSKITLIEQQKNNEDRCNIYVDDKFFMGVYKELVYKFSLKKNMEIDEVAIEKLKEMVYEEEYLKAKDKALRMVTRVPKSEKAVEEKLSEEYDEEIVARVIEFMKKYNYIDDFELARMIVHDRIKLSKQGKKRIMMELYKKGIPDYISNIVIEEMSDKDEEYEIALELAKKKLRTVRDTDRNKMYAKLSNHLAYKGFDYDLISSVVKEVLKNMEEDY